MVTLHGRWAGWAMCLIVRPGDVPAWNDPPGVVPIRDGRGPNTADVRREGTVRAVGREDGDGAADTSEGGAR